MMREQTKVMMMMFSYRPVPFTKPRRSLSIMSLIVVYRVMLKIVRNIPHICHPVKIFIINSLRNVRRSHIGSLKRDGPKMLYR